VRASSGLSEEARAIRSGEKAESVRSIEEVVAPKFKLLPRDFYERHPKRVARELLGKVLVRKIDAKTVLAGRIVETEAYLGKADLAAHAASGQTLRNAVLFGPAGHAYVYFTYGMYFCMNVSCEAEGKAGCVLFRAVEPLEGIDQMAELREISLSDPPKQKELKALASGPGRLCLAFHVTREFDNGKDFTSSKSDLQIADDDFAPKKIIATPRIGISKSTDLPLRYLVAGNPFVSGRKIVLK
jgi:DNA-3-methyladenine glycosylase